MENLKTQPNEKRCGYTVVKHTLNLHPCCPISYNPIEGSEIEITYTPAAFILEVASLRGYVDSFIGGRGDVRSMEGMCQQITQDAANTVGVRVKLVGRLMLNPNQRMTVECVATPVPTDK